MLTTPLPFSPFLDEACVDPDNRFVLDENAFLRAIMEPDDTMPIFLSAPSPAFMKAIERELVMIVARRQA